MDSINRKTIKLDTYHAATLADLQRELKRILKMTKAAGIKPHQVDIVSRLTLTYTVETNLETGAKFFRLNPSH